MDDRPKNKLYYYNARDQVHPLNTFYEGEENFDGIKTENRQWTDISILIIFLLLNVGLVYYAQTVIRESDWRRLYNGVDFRTDFCGHNQLINETFIYFYDPEGVGTIGICMKECPPMDNVDVCFYSQTNNQSLDDYCYKTYHTKSFGYYCMPMELDSPKRKIIENEMRSTFNQMKTIAGDLWRLKDIICISFGVMILAGGLFIVSFFHKKFLIISIIIYFIFGFGMIGFMLFLTPIDEERLLKKYCPNASSQNDCESSDMFFLFVLRFTMVGVVGFLFLALILYWKRLLKIAKFIAFFNDYIKIFTLLLYLFIHALVETAFLLFLLFIYVSAMSSGEVQTVDAPKMFPAPFYRKIVVSDLNVYGLIFVGFMFYWWIMAFNNFNKFVLSGAIATYYFSKSKQILYKPVSRGVKLGIFNNLGSILLCSFIIPIIWPIRSFFFRIKEILIKTLDKTTKRFKFCLGFWTPCLTLHENGLKFIRTRNLIHLVIFGDSFYRAGQKLFYLRHRNLSRIKAFTSYIGFVTLIGNIFIASSGACFLFAYSVYSSQTFIEEEISPIEYLVVTPVIIFLCGLILASGFGNLYDHLIETVMVCFIADEEMFTGNHRFAEEVMRKFMDLYGHESDDVRNFSTTKVNPFKQDRENEAIKYEPVVQPDYDNLPKIDKNLMNFIKADELEGTDGTGGKRTKYEKFYDPIQNIVKIHAIKENDEDNMEKSIKSQNLSQTMAPEEEKKSRPETPITYKALSNNKLPAPQAEVKENNSLKHIPESNSRPTSQQTNNKTQQLFLNQSRPISVDKNLNSHAALKIENVSRPTSSNNRENLNNSNANNKDKSFLEINKLEVEDLENSIEEDNEDKKSSYSMDNNLNFSPQKPKTEEDLNKVFNKLNNQFNLDQNRMKNNKVFGQTNMGDSQYHF